MQVNYKGQYLPLTVIKNCFKKQTVTHVNKVLCGNGFTTGFCKLQPEPHKLNIIIAPNKAVLISKEQDYKAGKLSNTRIKFFYKEGKASDFSNADILFFVADSFLLYENRINQIKHRIDKVLIDEYHSTEQQSTFRKKLVNFVDEVQRILPFSAITTVTATPNLYSKVDITLLGNEKKSYNINVSNNRKNALKRLKNDIKKGLNCIVFTNDKKVIYKLKNTKKVVEANFIVGENLMRAIVEGVKVENRPDSNLAIVSARGFEGFDLQMNDARVYFFEDRSNKHEGFYISNLYQAINRNKLNTSYIEYNRQELGSERSDLFNDIDSEINEFIENKELPAEAKQRREYRKYHDFVIFKQNENASFTIQRNETAISLHKERNIYDKQDFENNFKDFLNQRNIEIERISEVNNRLVSKMKAETKKQYLKQNETLIENLDLFGSNFRLQVLDLHDKKQRITFDLRVKYLKQLEAYLMRKNYNLEREPSEREKIAYNVLSNEIHFRTLFNSVLASYKNHASRKYTARERSEKINEFKCKAINLICQFCLAFANDRIYIPKKLIANRDYNILTELNLDAINAIAKEFNIEVTEIDIRTCNPRILYALNGSVLPLDFYGTNKQNKKAINVLLNSFRFDASKKRPKKLQKITAKEQFEKYGFNDAVKTYLLNTFFETPYRSDLFNFLAYHESKIVNKLASMLSEQNEGKARRHDSVLVFNNAEDLSWINNFKYLGIKGWFDVPDFKVMPLPIYNENEFSATGTNGVIVL